MYENIRQHGNSQHMYGNAQGEWKMNGKTLIKATEEVPLTNYIKVTGNVSGRWNIRLGRHFTDAFGQLLCDSNRDLEMPIATESADADRNLIKDEQ